MPVAGLRALAAILICAMAAPYMAFGQGAAVPESVKAMAGSWELSNAERDRTCVVVLRTSASGPGFGLQWESKCKEAFAFTGTVVAWKIGARDALQFLDVGGAIVAELTEVEGGLYEGERRGQGLLFLQSMASRAAEERVAAQLAGDWAFTASTGKLLCRISLATTPAAAERLALSVQPGCDPLVARFAPAAWQLDRGQLVLISGRGEAWRFEEVDALTWRRIPAGRQPLTLVRQ